MMYTYIYLKPLIDFNSNEKSDCLKTVVLDMLLLDEFFIIVILSEGEHLYRSLNNPSSKWACCVKVPANRWHHY